MEVHVPEPAQYYRAFGNKLFFFSGAENVKKDFHSKWWFRAEIFFSNQLFGLLLGRPDLNEKKI